MISTMLSTSKLVLFSASALILGAGCVSQQDLEEIKKNQRDLVAAVEKLPKTGRVKPPPGPVKPSAEKTYGVPLGNAPVKGATDAWITLVTFSDFECPFCSRVNGTLSALHEKYGDRLRVAFKHKPLPFHKRAMPAARAAACAGEQGKFWPMHDQLFANQRQLGDADLEGYAQQAGVDVAAWKSCVASKRQDAAIRNDAVLSQRFGVSGTPAFFINGRFLSGAQPQARFEALIDEELKKAEASGVARGQYYQKQVVGRGLKKL